VRRRLTITLVGLVAGALVLVGAGGLVVARLEAEHTAVDQLRQQASVLASRTSQIERPRVLLLVRRLLRLDDARVVVVTPAGFVRTPLPHGFVPSDLDPAALLAGEVVTGSAGGDEFVAQPLALSSPLASLLPGGRLAVLLTRGIGGILSSWAYLLLVGGGTLVVAAAMASWLSRRITRPIRLVRDATARVASGELSARVPVRPGEVEELATLAESVNVMAESLEEARARERQLLLSVAHDLRTPLTSIGGYAEAIEEGVADSPSEAAHVIRLESRRLERLVGDLLDLAKLDARRLSLELAAVPADELVAEVVAAMRPEAERRGISLSLFQPPRSQGVEPGGPLVLADRDRLAQVLGNLLENAVSFARTSVQCSVSGPVAASSSAVTFAVEDDGPGIAEADLVRVFERFYQANGRGALARRGSGLGLSIVSELVSAMGGRVWAESPTGPGGGTRMVAELPSA
jgi:signal transduction histidine kinase